jgi:UDP-N-acetylglucosamine diphosphorylase / glucose-1-phosphate thymidylyltransferase / UDP-N-acetylgalactosamine diphosphorylase / glucosamine-1-phosphate N-acetyltransferase / galactosamine-1-phosphate N-acetyltransferase
MRIADYIESFERRFPFLASDVLPWDITSRMPALIAEIASNLTMSGFRGADGIVIHETAIVEPGASLQAPIIVAQGCYVAATAVLRGGVFLDRKVSIGPGCEVKAALIMAESALAHFNYVGDSIVGSKVNLEAGAVVANDLNEHELRDVVVYIGGVAIPTGVPKFGALIGDEVRIGANAVLSPGTVLEPREVVGRLELVDQGSGTRRG